MSGPAGDSCARANLTPPWQCPARDANAGLTAAFAEVNAAGGLSGRQFDVVSAEYSGDPTADCFEVEIGPQGRWGFFFYSL